MYPNESWIPNDDEIIFFKSKVLLTLTGRTLSRLGFLQNGNKRAQQRKFLVLYLLGTIIPGKYANNFRCWESVRPVKVNKTLL